MTTETRKRELAIIQDYRERAATEKSEGWSCTIETSIENVIIIENPNYPDDRYEFRYDDYDRMMNEIPEWISVEMSSEDYFLAQLMNW